MADDPITVEVQGEAFMLLKRMNERWMPGLGYQFVEDDLYLKVVVFLEGQGIGVELPDDYPWQSEFDCDYTPAEIADSLQVAADHLVRIVRTYIPPEVQGHD